jgi:hypothetical protein
MIDFFRGIAGGSEIQPSGYPFSAAIVLVKLTMVVFNVAINL